MRRFGDYSLNENVPLEKTEEILVQTAAFLEQRFGERRPIELWKGWDEVSPYERIVYAILVFNDTNNASAPCIAKTRKRLEAMFCNALRLKEIGLNYKEDCIHGNKIEYPPDFDDYWEAFNDAWSLWATRNGLSVSDWGAGIFREEILRLVNVLEIAINDVLPPKKDKYDEYPEPHSPIELLIRHLLEFYYMYVEKCEVEPMGKMPNIEKIKSKAMGTPKKPGDLFLFTQDICQALRLGWTDRPDLLRKKFYDVIRKIKKTNQNAEIQKS